MGFNWILVMRLEINSFSNTSDNGCDKEVKFLERRLNFFRDYAGDDAY